MQRSHLVVTGLLAFLLSLALALGMAPPPTYAVDPCHATGGPACQPIPPTPTVTPTPPGG